MSSLFDAIKLGSIDAKNRVIMAPLTRARSQVDAVPTAIMVEYYSQRASAGLIISEATGISREGLGWPNAPGIWSDEQVEAWKLVTAGVHQHGGKIVCQLWHMGRAVHSSVTGVQPVSASSTAAPGEAHTYEGKKTYETARALTIEDIERILNDYEQTTRNALAAGFDGVQVHAANGYLIDQFLRDSTNQRDDEYGGTPENRIRLLKQVVERVISIAGADRVSVRMSPNGDSQGCIDSNPEAVFVPAAEALDQLGVSWLELREPGVNGTFGKTDQPKLSPVIRKAFRGPLVLNQDYTREEALAEVETGVADAISFGRKFIGNPDLVERLERDLPLAKDNMATWYRPGAEGYTDYPAAG
ncbi:NADH:flavin oxidoreductase [Neokomagataea thailandica NBRC 106555]|uniref:Alkene reductase n=2 Tax=Neokomagataea TaxID=1223423 RepID=A0A4Y6VA63_9PROT|nr:MULTISPECIES: alkene reductase [Neokomagataea]QDH25396.1 alkene reductase [Neokomagataea tanensis]GBR53520.1 NADH:flavin oxidoreductase [Neokomagataea thailandica NBRC 106555]